MLISKRICLWVEFTRFCMFSISGAAEINIYIPLVEGPPEQRKYKNAKHLNKKTKDSLITRARSFAQRHKNAIKSGTQHCFFLGDSVR